MYLFATEYGCISLIEHCQYCSNIISTGPEVYLFIITKLMGTSILVGIVSSSLN